MVEVSCEAVFEPEELMRAVMDWTVFAALELQETPAVMAATEAGTY